MRDIHATPAYGRDYKSARDVLTDWKAGKDFYSDYGYLSIRDSDRVPGQIWVRYNKFRNIVRVH